MHKWDLKMYTCEYITIEICDEVAGTLPRCGLHVLCKCFHVANMLYYYQKNNHAQCGVFATFLVISFPTLVFITSFQCSYPNDIILQHPCKDIAHVTLISNIIFNKSFVQVYPIPMFQSILMFFQYQYTNNFKIARLQQIKVSSSLQNKSCTRLRKPSMVDVLVTYLRGAMHNFILHIWIE